MTGPRICSFNPSTKIHKTSWCWFSPYSSSFDHYSHKHNHTHTRHTRAHTRTYTHTHTQTHTSYIVDIPLCSLFCLFPICWFYPVHAPGWRNEGHHCVLLFKYSKLCYFGYTCVPKKRNDRFSVPCKLKGSYLFTSIDKASSAELREWNQNHWIWLSE